jgi:hypothetical protein
LPAALRVLVEATSQQLRKPRIEIRRERVEVRRARETDARISGVVSP